MKLRFIKEELRSKCIYCGGKPKRVGAFMHTNGDVIPYLLCDPCDLATSGDIKKFNEMEKSIMLGAYGV